jgi:uncharacterized protein (DUF362 family)
MKKNSINRRKFLVSTLEGAAGIGVLAGCSKRSVIGLDERRPSIPVGLTRKIEKLNDVVTVTLSWTPHDLTDFTGAKNETAISYNVYRDGAIIGQGLSSPGFRDSNGLAENSTYMYRISAVDANGLESDPTAPLAVPIQPFVNVYRVTNTAAVPGTVSKPNIVPAEVKRMLDAALVSMTGQATAALAWESLLTGVTATSLVGIKINTLGGSYAGSNTKPEVVDAIASGLVQMLGGTFPAHNIIVFDDRTKDYHMKNAGFFVRDEPDKYRIVSINWNTSLNGVPQATAETDAQKWVATVDVAGISQKVTRIVDAVDFIINVPILKDHSAAGITFALKNFYGIVSNPSGMHGSAGQWCNPYIPALYSIEVNSKKIRDKVKLTVGDALLAVVSGGPAATADTICAALLLGTDPVALDSLALDTINSYRVSRGMKQYSYDETGMARHILAASKDPYFLGSTNYALKEVPLA